MWYLIILGAILLAANWILPAVTHQEWVYVIAGIDMQLWMAGGIALIIGLIWLVISSMQKKA
jgi:hypothetical protein